MKSYVFIPKDPNLKTKWKLIICEQVDMTYKKNGSQSWVTYEGKIISIKEDPEIRQRVEEERYKKYLEDLENERRMEEEKKQKELEDQINSIPFLKNNIKIVSNEFKSTYEKAIHFGHSEGPIAPKTDGGYYLCYYNINDKHLHVIDFDSNDRIKNNFDTKYNAYPHDIVETTNGFVAYLLDVKDDNHSFLISFDKNGKKLWEKNIMNNKNPKKNPNKKVNQIKDPSNGFGMNCIFEPCNAKLHFANNRIALIFSHYNNFDWKSDCHTGDTFITLDLKTGTKYDFAWSWKTSHSLNQSIIFDGKYWITTSLGDAYPEGITFSAIDSTGEVKGKNYRNCIIDQSLIHIPGLMNGSSYGKMGSIVKLNEENLYGLIYTVTPSKKDKRDQISLFKFKFENESFVKVDDIVIKTGFGYSMCNVRNGRLGNDKIIITYILDESLTDCTHFWIRNDVKMYFLVIDFDGNILEDFESPNNYQNVSDDLRNLNDGTLRWTHIDKNSGILNVIKASP